MRPRVRSASIRSYAVACCGEPATNVYGRCSYGGFGIAIPSSRTKRNHTFVVGSNVGGRGHACDQCSNPLVPVRKELHAEEVISTRTRSYTYKRAGYGHVGKKISLPSTSHANDRVTIVDVTDKTVSSSSRPHPLIRFGVYATKEDDLGSSFSVDE